MSFRIKLLLTFILFAIFITSFLIYSFSNIIESRNLDNQVDIIENVLDKKDQRVLNYLQNLREVLYGISNNSDFQKFAIDGDSKTQVQNLFYTVMNTRHCITQLRFIDNNGQELIRVDKNKKTTTLQNKSNRYYFKKIKQQPIHSIWYSKFDLNMENGKIELPKKETLRIGLNLDTGILIINFTLDELRYMMESYNYDMYLVDKDGNILIDSNRKYCWSKYLHKNIKINDILGEKDLSFMKHRNYSNDKFMIKKLSFVNDDEAYFVLKFPTSLSETIENEMFPIYIIITALTVVISIILAYTFSRPLLKLVAQKEKAYKILDKEVERKTLQLKKSLNIIDRYVIRSSTDLDGTITDVSEAFCKISGYEKSELIGKPHSIVRHPSMSKELFKDMWDTITAGKTWSGVIQNKTRNNGSYWVQAFIEPEFDENGTIQSYNAIRHNITSEMLLESQMKKNNAIINFANSAIGTMDFEGRFLSVNSVYTKLLGYTKEELIGKSCLELTVPEDLEKGKKVLEDAKELGLVSHVEKRCFDKYGNKIHVDMSLNKLPDGKSFVVVVNSLEDKKKLEQINSSLAKQVEQEVKKNMLQLEAIQTEQLKHAKLSSIGLIAAGVIHEINTPLTYIKGNVEMFRYDIEDLNDSPIKERIEDDIEKIYGGISRIENIINSMREVSQISSETKKLENIYGTIITSLTVLNTATTSVVKVVINEEEFHLGMDKKKFLLLSNVQKQRLEQVWIVIINNAMDELIKIDDYKNRKFEIKFFEKDEKIVVQFKDNAGGISDEMMPILFDPLSSTKESGGIGIGLNIAKKIIEDQDGEIIAYNENGGAVFEVILPLTKG